MATTHSVRYEVHLNRVHILLIVVLLCFTSATFAANPPPPVDILKVAKGQTLLLEYQGVQRVSVGNADLLQVEVFNEESEVLLIALEIGTTDLRLWADDADPLRYIIQVYDGDDYLTDAQIETLISDIEGVELVPVGNNFVLQGKAEDSDDFSKIKQLADTYPSISSYVTEPSFESAATVLMHARLLEIRKSALTEIGVSWENTINGPVVGQLFNAASNDFFGLTGVPNLESVAPVPLSTEAAGYAGISTSLSSTINLLMQNGNARLLAEPTLACVSGGSADFLVGGEVPIPIRDSNGTPSVEFKEFGIILKFSPIADSRGRISTDIAVEVSTLDPSIQVLGIPGFATRKTNTRMNLNEGDTMVIAGLVSHEDAKNVDKVPLLGQIPILGELFKSRGFRNQETELVILITPSLLDSSGTINTDYKNRFDELENVSAEAVRFKLLD